MSLQQGVARNLLVFMTDSADHVTGKTGLTLTITASKLGGAFATITPVVTELGNGWYSLALTANHLDSVGDLALHVTASGADPSDLCRDVNAWENKLAAHAGAVLKVVIGTGSTITSIVLSTVDGAAPSTLNDAYRDRVLVMTSGGATQQAKAISGYVGLTTVAHVDAFTTAPSVGDVGVII